MIALLNLSEFWVGLKGNSPIARPAIKCETATEIICHTLDIENDRITLEYRNRPN